MLPAMRKRSAFPGFIDEFFGRDLPGFFFDSDNRFNTPAVNISETKDDYRIELAAPGLEKNDIKIDLDNNVLTISSEKKEEHEEKEERYMRREFSYSTFSRSFSLPESVDVENIKASHKDGVLEVVLPKSEKAKVKAARQIKIS